MLGPRLSAKGFSSAPRPATSSLEDQMPLLEKDTARLGALYVEALSRVRSPKCWERHKCTFIAMAVLTAVSAGAPYIARSLARSLVFAPRRFGSSTTPRAPGATSC